LRRLRIVGALAVIGTAAVAYSLPKLYAQTSSANATSAAASVPIAVANGISARALALGFTTAESSRRPDIYLTATDHPNRVLALAAAIRGVTAASASANLVAIGGSGEAGSLGDGGAATAAQLNLKLDSLNERSGVAVAADGTMFIADTRNSTIRRIPGPSSSDADVIRSVAGKWAPQRNVQLVEPMGIALDRVGNLYIADHGANAILELHDATSSTPGPLEVLAQIVRPASIAVTPDGSRVFVASPEISTVSRFDTGQRPISNIAGLIFSGETSPSLLGACTSINHSNGVEHGCPAGLAIDGGGNLFVSDPIGNEILRFDAAMQNMTAAATGVIAPGEIAFDANGNLFIAEQGRNRISEIQRLGQPVSSVTLTPPAPITPPVGTPCPAIAPPLGSSSNFNFCAEPLAGITPLSAFTLTNDSNADITGVTVGFIGINPGDFVSPSGSCTSILRANSSCAVNVGFAPTAAGPRTATLVVNYSGPTVPLTAALAGTGEDYQITLASGQLTEISVAAGDKGTFMLQVVPDNIFTGTVTFVCPGNLPAQTTCMFSPATSVNVTTPGTPVPFSVSFQTTSRTPTKNLAPHNPGPNIPAGGGTARLAPGFLSFRFIFRVAFGALAILALISLAFSAPQRRTQLLRVASVLALALSVAAFLEGCHSYSATGTTGTPVGSTKLTVQGAAQGASRGITVTLDVE
jgi:sugar lactone lactonase YvrE